MSITDELRVFRMNAFSRIDPMALKLLEITNRIDDEHKRQLVEARAEGIAEGIDADFEAREHHGWVKLPVDANGEPIHIGDKVTEHEDGHTFKVDGFMDWGGEWWVFMRDGIQAPASRCTHYHAPTVEDVLSEMLNEAFPSDFTHRSEAIEAMVAEYAAKLQLKEVDG